MWEVPLEEGTDIPIKGTTVLLSEITSVNGRSTVIATATTDEGGHYQINYFKVPTASYVVEFFNSDFILRRMHSNRMQISRYKTVVNFSMIPRAFVKIRFVKTVASDTSVIVKLNSHSFGEGPNILWHFPLTYQPYDTTETCAIFGNKLLEIEWFKFDVSYPIGNPYEHNYPYRDAFFVKKGDTLNYTITFN